MKYRIVGSHRIPKLEEEVNSLIAEGWQPLGGVSINEYGYQKEGADGCNEAVEYQYYAQAMMLIDKP